VFRRGRLFADSALARQTALGLSPVQDDSARKRPRKPSCPVRAMAHDPLEERPFLLTSLAALVAADAFMAARLEPAFPHMCASMGPYGRVCARPEL
jgi:hypothetical protein